MIRDTSTSRRDRAIQSDAYAEAGDAGFTFSIPQPFVAEDFTAVAERLQLSAIGLANQCNQVLSENLGNNMAARVKKAAKDGTDLPNQEDMDALYDSYDFSGTRIGGAAYGSPYERHFFKLAGQFIRKLIKGKGYQDMPAPVTVAKRDAEPTGTQISHETFEMEVARLVNGEGPWAESELHIELRQKLSDEAQSQADKEAEAARATESALAGATLL